MLLYAGLILGTLNMHVMELICLLLYPLSQENQEHLESHRSLTSMLLYTPSSFCHSFVSGSVTSVRVEFDSESVLYNRRRSDRPSLTLSFPTDS